MPPMKTILLFLSYCIDFQACNFERQQLVQLDPKEMKTQILECLKLQNQNLKQKKKQGIRSTTSKEYKYKIKIRFEKNKTNKNTRIKKAQR
ncbi:hypothetical protein BD0086_00010 [Helicobacter pylori]